MSRSAVFSAITSNASLNAVGIDEDSVFHNYSLEQRPVPTGPFMILRWESQDAPAFRDDDLGDVKSPVRLIIWTHFPLEETNDFSRIDEVMDLCDSSLRSVKDVAGVDGYTVTCIRATGRSGDFKDDGFQTITKNSGYEVLSRRTI